MASRRSRPVRFPRMGTLLSQEGGGMDAGSALLDAGRVLAGAGRAASGAAPGGAEGGAATGVGPVGSSVALAAGAVGSTAPLSSELGVPLPVRLLARAESGASSSTRFG